MKNIVFLSLLVGLTACNLTSLRVVEDAPAGGDISGDINLPRPQGAIEHHAEYSNQLALTRFSIEVVGLVQYNINYTDSQGSGSYNWYFDNTANPTKIVSTSTLFFGKNYTSRVSEYEVARLSDSAYTSFVLNDGSSVQLPNGGRFFYITSKFARTKVYDGATDTFLADWAPFTSNVVAWIKISDNNMWITLGEVSSSDPTRILFYADPSDVSEAYTNR